jgi:hypothetical protein
MNIFGAIMDKIFHHPAAQPAVDATNPAAAAQPAVDATNPAAAPAVDATNPATAPAQPVDVEAVLSAMADEKGFDGNWDTSIVDLLKLLDMDSSLDARKQLADELNVHEGEPGTAEENIALHKAVMQKLAENGGKVPANLKGA